MKITEVRTRVVQWEGKTVPLPPHFCTNPMDLVAFREASMGNFAFHNWLIGRDLHRQRPGRTRATLRFRPMVTKQLIDIYLKPLLIGADPWDIEYLWQQMYRRTLAFGRKGVALTAISAVDIALWDLLGKDAKQPVFKLLGGRTKENIPVYASRLYAMPIPELRAEAQKYKDEGYKMMKLRFGWGPLDGAAGMQKNIELVRNVREVIGYDIDLMTDAYMGWTLDYAKRMLPLLEPFQLALARRGCDSRRHARLQRAEELRPRPDRRRRARVHDLRLPRVAREQCARRNSVRHQPRRRHQPGAQDLRAGRIVPGSGHAARRADAQLSRRHGEPELSDRRVLSARLMSKSATSCSGTSSTASPRRRTDVIDLDDNLPGLGLTVNEESLKRFHIVE